MRNKPHDGERHIEFEAFLEDAVAAWIEGTGCERPEVIYRRERFADNSGFTVVIELAFNDPAHATAFKIRWL